jgi:hypothetical protein
VLVTLAAASPCCSFSLLQLLLVAASPYSGREWSFMHQCHDLDELAEPVVKDQHDGRARAAEDVL